LSVAAALALTTPLPPRGERPKKDQGRIYLLTFLYGVFELPSPRETPKNVVKTNREKKGFGLLSIFCKKLFGTTALLIVKSFSLRNIQKNAIKQSN
jgi:hypothetical protein